MDASTRAALFDLIGELVKSRPLRATLLSDHLGLSFRQDRSASNPYFQIYHAQGNAKPPVSSAIVAAELREPVAAPKEGHVNGMLSLEINPKLCVSKEEVQQRFGRNPELSVPTPHGPVDAPLYWVYPQDWGKLSFGFSRREPCCLVSVTLDAIPDR